MRCYKAKEANLQGCILADSNHMTFWKRQNLETEKTDQEFLAWRREG